MAISTDDDRLYLDLKGARERLCRAQTSVEHEAHREWLQSAIDRIDSIGAFLPPWSKFDLPEVEEL